MIKPLAVFGRFARILDWRNIFNPSNRMQISIEDVSLIKSMRQSGVLQDLTEKDLDQRNGLIKVVCADGDQFHDLYNYFSQISSSHRETPRIHTLALNGGGLLLPDESPLNESLAQGKVLRQNLQVARQLKKIDTVAVCIHAPCGAAKLAKIDLAKAVSMVLSSAKLVANENPGAAVKPLIHVDYGDGRKRTYQVNGEKYAQFQQ